MTKKLFCGGLPWEATDDDLAKTMSEFGEVEDAKVVTDRETGRSKGFGFVTFATEEGAEQALAAESMMMMGRRIRFDEANERQDRGGGRGGPGRRPSGQDEGREGGRKQSRNKKHKNRGGSNHGRWDY